jgi:hypothetical protein
LGTLRGIGPPVIDPFGASSPAVSGRAWSMSVQLAGSVDSPYCQITVASGRAHQGVSGLNAGAVCGPVRPRGAPISGSSSFMSRTTSAAKSWERATAAQYPRGKS